MNLSEIRNQIKEFRAVVFRDFQLFRLRIDRIMSKAFFPGRKRILATACWNFPIFSQTFVYQELTQLIRRGFKLRFIYAKLDSRKNLPAQFNSLWHARRKMNLHWAVCKRDYEYFLARMPEKIERLVNLTSQASGLTPDELRNHHHFMEAFAFTRMVEAYRPDYLHSYFFYEGTLFTFFASYLLGIPRGVSCYADHMLNDYVLKLVPIHLQQCSLVIATSHQIKKELLQIAPIANAEHILVKPNAINAAQFQVTPHKEPNNGEPFRLVSVSRIEPKKGLVYLAEAVGKLRERNLNVEWHLIGTVDANSSSKEYANELKQRINELQLQTAIHLEGKKSETEIKQLFKSAHLFVAPFIETQYGDKDGIPTSLLEGMSSGLPVVATDSGSILEVIENGRDGVIVPQRDSAALAEAISGLMNDSERKVWLGKNAARKIREKFDVNICEQTFHDRLTELLSSPQKRTAVELKERPLVSAITIFYNGEKFLQEAIESVIAQSYKHWEYLLVDDGSTDRSTEIANEYANKYPGKIRYLEHTGHENRGMSATRNLGVREAKGEYVAFLDADDFWLPHKLERQVAIMEAYPQAAMLYGKNQYWYSWTGNPEDADRDEIPELGIPANALFEPPGLQLLLYPLGTATAPCPSDLMIRKKRIEDLGGFEEHFRGKYQLYEDQGFLAKMYLKFPVFVSDECWDRYRKHPESCLAVVTGAGQYDSVRHYFLNWFEQYLSQQESKPAVVSEALQRALLPYRNPASVENSSAEAPSSEPPTANHESSVEATSNGLHWGSLRRLDPISLNWGFDRGLPVDRYYIENFLRKYAGDIRGRTLEIEDDMYTRRFGGNQTTIRDVLHVIEGNPRATIVGDLTSADHIPSDTFDCAVITQTLHLIYDIKAALRTLHRILKPGGVLLATFPGITRVSHTEWSDLWFWSFTGAGARRLFEEAFPSGDVRIQVHGNVLAGISFLHGVAAEELQKEELDYDDPDYEVLITVRAQKAAPSPA